MGRQQAIVECTFELPFCQSKEQLHKQIRDYNQMDLLNKLYQNVTQWHLTYFESSD